MANEAKDEKPQGADSSPAPETADASQSASANAATDVKETSISEAVEQHLKSQEATDSSPEGEVEEESGSESEQDPAKEDESSETEKEDSSTEKDGTKGPIPYDRFEEVVRERDTFKQQVGEIKPKVEAYDNIHSFCTRFEVTPQQFQEALELRALLNTNPAEALKRILPIVEELQGFVGEKLPNDLQAAVDEGKLTLEYARELAQVRAQRQFGEKKLQHDRQSFEQTQQQELRRQISDAVVAWETKTRGSDPDYKPKAKATDPDGKWEDVKDKFVAWLNEVDSRGQPVNPVHTVADYVALLNRAYSNVSGRSRPKPATRKTLSSNGSSSTTSTTKRIEDAPTLGEAVKIVLAGVK